MKGFLITIEGGEGSGKTTVARYLAKRLEELGLSVVRTKEPGSSFVGEWIRDLLMKEWERKPKTEVLLFLADRAEHMERVIRPALLNGKLVVCDRFIDSTLAYQGFGLGLDITEIEQLNRWVTGSIRPDVTLLLDLPPEVGLERSCNQTVFEKRGLAFHQRIRAGYLSLAEREPDRFRVIDAMKPLEEVLAACEKAVTECLFFRGRLPVRQ